MVCRCLFSTRCLHTWLDPRGISEMFLAPIRNHILLPFIPLAVPSAARRSLSLSLSSFPSILPLPHPRLPPCRACRVCRPRPPIVDADDIATRVFRSFPPRLPGQICLCTAFIYSTAVEPRFRPVSVAQPSRRVCHAKARANVLIIILDGRN